MAVEKDKQADASGAAKLPDSNGVLSKEAKRRKKEQEAKDAELSEEDLELKQNLEMMLERIKDSDSGVQSNALQVHPGPAAPHIFSHVPKSGQAIPCLPTQQRAGCGGTISLDRPTDSECLPCCRASARRYGQPRLR